MDYSKQNNEKKRKKIRSNAAKSKKKITFNIFRFTMLAILLIRRMWNQRKRPLLL